MRPPRASWLVLLLALALAGLTRCSSTTEIVVVVDTDLAPRAEVDEIEVTVDGSDGFSQRKTAQLPAAGSLPLTLGIRAGSDPNARVTIRAVARRGGRDVTAASLRTAMVEGESRMAHVSLCRSCGAECAVAEKDDLPAWTGSPPAVPSCPPEDTADRDAAGAADASPDAVADARIDGLTSDATADAPIDAIADAWPFGLHCEATVLCDGFEGKTAPEQPPIVGTWNDVQDAGGTITLGAIGAAAGQQFVRFTSPANSSGASKRLLLGATPLSMPNAATVTIAVDVDMHIETPNPPLAAGARRNLVGMYLYSPLTLQEFAGISIAEGKGLHVEMNNYASASDTAPASAPHAPISLAKLTDAWHHVHFEATFARTATGGAFVTIDGVEVARLSNLLSRTNSATSPNFVFWIGANANPVAPALTVRYDNVEVRAK